MERCTHILWDSCCLGHGGVGRREAVGVGLRDEEASVRIWLGCSPEGI